MSKKIITGLTIIAVLLLLTLPASAAITQFQATEAASSYGNSNEVTKAYGPYTISDHPYYYVTFMIGTDVTGIVVIDGDSGEVITDENIIRMTSYTNYMIGDITSEDVTNTIQSATKSRKDALDYKNDSMAFEKNANRQMNSQVAYNLSKSLLNTSDALTKEAVAYDELANIEKDVINGNKSYENAVKMEEKYRNLIIALSDVTSNLKEDAINLNAFYDMIANNPGSYNMNRTEVIAEQENWNAELEGDLKTIEMLFEEINRILDTDMKEYINWDVESSASRTNNKVPGFGIIFSIAAILVGFVLINKNKK